MCERAGVLAAIANKSTKIAPNIGEWLRKPRVPNGPTGQVSEAGPDWPVLVEVDDWTRLTWVVRSGLDWSQTSLYKDRMRVGMTPRPTLAKNRSIAIE